MKFICVAACLFLSASSPDWICRNERGYTIYYQEAEQPNIDGYNSLIEKGMQEVKNFFGANYKDQFAVYVHPDRHSLDSTWQKEWKMPEFKSECWMVASGIADRMDLISPKQWTKQSCEHDYSDIEATLQLITHELVHVFHGQNNRSRDFSESEDLDWFAEGLATYASGQLTREKILQVRQAARDHQTPSSLNDFWKGKMRYQQSGSIVMFVDKTYGRKKLISLLLFTKKSEVLSALHITEEKLVADWEKFVNN